MSDNKFGAQFPGSYNLFEDAFIIGESDNIGARYSIALLKAIEI